MRSRQSIETELRDRIQNGVYLPGARIPPHRELQVELGVSSLTLQRAFNRLAEQGYVAARGNQGTFVADRLPHVNTIAIVLPGDLAPTTLSAWFCTTIKRVCEHSDVSGDRFRMYEMGGGTLDCPGHRDLCRDLEDGSFAAVFFVYPPSYLDGSPVLTAKIPRVVLNGRGQADVVRYGASIIELVNHNYLEDILAGFAAKGRRRVAAFAAPGTAAEFADMCSPLLRCNGIATSPEWWIEQPISPSESPCARGVAKLLFSIPARYRPDCLFITDDNLVPHVTDGILDARITVPAELAIACHANFPKPTRASVPCIRYGPDISAMMQAALDASHRLINGQEPELIKVTNVIRR